MKRTEEEKDVRELLLIVCLLDTIAPDRPLFLSQQCSFSSKSELIHYFLNVMANRSAAVRDCDGVGN